MARILIVGCGCRGRALAAQLAGEGHTVRGTTRDGSRAGQIESAGAESVVADPDRLGTLMPALAGVSVVCWLMGSAREAPELHGERLRTFTERLVDTHVRGLVYEAAGSASPALLGKGEESVRRASAVWRIPVEVVDADPVRHAGWLAAMTQAVGRLLGP